jgi:hypothetical protein
VPASIATVVCADLMAGHLGAATRQANRLVADLDRVLTADNVMSLEASDVLASRVFSKDRSGN